MFGKNYKRYVLCVLTIVFMMNYTDRYFFGVALQSIKHDLRLSDTELGFVSGFPFAIFYVTMGIPIARWADRGNRAMISALAIGTWGVTVMLCAVVGSLVQLTVARIGSAVGEAGCMPPTYSLVGNYFEGGEYTHAISIYMMGGPSGALIGLALGGWLVDMFGWRIAFLLLGLPGLLIALLVQLTVAEPRTQGTTGKSRAVVPPFREVLAVIRKSKSFRHLISGMSLLSLLFIGFLSWFAAFLMRSHHMTSGEAGLWLGVIMSVVGAVGVGGGGYLAGRFMQSREDRQMRWCGVGVALLLPFLTLFLLLPEKDLALVALVPVILLFNFLLGPVYGLIQRLVPDRMQATALATNMMITSLIGMGLGPQVVGILSDSLGPILGTNSLRYAMLIVSTVALWAGYHIWCVGRTVTQDLLTVRLQREGTAALVCVGGEPVPVKLLTDSR